MMIMRITRIIHMKKMIERTSTSTNTSTGTRTLINKMVNLSHKANSLYIVDIIYNNENQCNDIDDKNDDNITIIITMRISMVI